MLGHRVGIGPGGGGEPDAGAADGRAVVLVGPGADRLDEAQARGAGDQHVVPQHRHDEHVGLGDAGLELGTGADLEPADTGVAGGETLAHPVGGVGEGDGQAVVGRQGRQHRAILARGMGEGKAGRAPLESLLWVHAWRKRPVHP